MGHKLSTERLFKCAAALLTLTNSFPSDKHNQDTLRQRFTYFLASLTNNGMFPRNSI